MNRAVEQMLEQYDLKSRDDAISALKEIVQEIALLGLWRAKFFEHAAFYGGTCLRLLYGLNRFSEDLDFSLLKPDSSFAIGQYEQALVNELRDFGFHVSVVQKKKSKETAIQSAFLKADTLEHLIYIGFTTQEQKHYQLDKDLKVKLEVDTDPPPGFDLESHYLLTPIPYTVRAFSAPDLLAGKVHALLCRGWGKRVKGRDWYDLVWFVGQQIPAHLVHLGARMQQSGHLEAEGLTEEVFREHLHARVDTLDIPLARNDIAPFIQDKETLSLWSPDFFHAVVDRLTVC